MNILVAAAIIFNNDQILIARRAPGKHLAGYWEFPGGKIEPGETPEACLIREIQEELGITIQVDSFLIENPYQYEEKQILLKAYLCSYLGGEIQLNDHDQVLWVNKNELKNYKLAPADIAFIIPLNQL